MWDLSISSQAIAQIFLCDTIFLEYLPKKHCPKTIIHPKEFCIALTPPQPLVATPKDNPMQIIRMWFKSFMNGKNNIKMQIIFLRVVDN